MAGWYNSQLATKLPGGRPNSAVRKVATTPGLPWEPEMPADQAAHVRTILCAKNILPTPGALLSNQLFTVSHPPENLEIHPPDPPKSQIPTFQPTSVWVMPILGEQPANHNPVLQPTGGIFIPKLLPGHTSLYPHVLFADIPDMTGIHVPILHLDSTHHAYL